MVLNTLETCMFFSLTCPRRERVIACLMMTPGATPWTKPAQGGGVGSLTRARQSRCRAATPQLGRPVAVPASDSYSSCKGVPSDQVFGQIRTHRQRHAAHCLVRWSQMLFTKLLDLYIYFLSWAFKNCCDYSFLIFSSELSSCSVGPVK